MEGDGENFFLPGTEDPDQAAAGRVPELHGAVPAGGGQAAAVRTEADAVDKVAMGMDAPRQPDLVLRGCVPENALAVVICTGEPLSVRVIGHALRPCLVPFETLQLSRFN